MNTALGTDILIVMTHSCLPALVDSSTNFCHQINTRQITTGSLFYPNAIEYLRNDTCYKRMICKRNKYRNNMNHRQLVIQWRRRVVILTMLFVVVPPNVRVLAGRDKLTTAPTVSWRPTVTPTKSPSPTISWRPTVQPTITVDPSSVPSTGPSLRPSIFPVVRSIPPTLTLTPSSGPPTVAVAMPKLSFLLQTEGSIDGAEIETALNGFLSDYLSQGTYKSSFRFINLETTVEQENNVVSLSITDGQAHFDPAVNLWPSVEELSSVLSTYFSFWGDQNLKDYLVSKQFPVVNVSDVLLDGEQLASQGDLTAIPANRPDTDSNKSSSNDSDQFNALAIVGIVVGVVVGVVAVGLFAHTRQRQKRSAEGTGSDVVVIKPISDVDMEDEIKNEIKTFPTEDSNMDQANDVAEEALVNSSEDDDNNANEGTFIEHLPPTLQIRLTQPVHEYVEHDGAESSDGDIISVAESLVYREQDKHGPLFNVKSIGTSISAKHVSADESQATLTPGVKSARPAHHSVFQYDASRLDQVISNAKSEQDEK
jgi:hypothetical protein